MILSFVSLIPLPGGMTKFAIRYDLVGEAYFSLANPVASEFDYTKDLVNLTDWKIVADRLLYDDTGLGEIDSLRYTGFDYVD